MQRRGRGKSTALLNRIKRLEFITRAFFAPLAAEDVLVFPTPPGEEWCHTAEKHQHDKITTLLRGLLVIAVFWPVWYCTKEQQTVACFNSSLLSRAGQPPKKQMAWYPYLPGDSAGSFVSENKIWDLGNAKVEWELRRFFCHYVFNLSKLCKPAIN